jgi:hypothetical protein
MQAHIHLGMNAGHPHMGWSSNFRSRSAQAASRTYSDSLTAWKGAGAASSLIAEYCAIWQYVKV